MKFINKVLLVACVVTALYAWGIAHGMKPGPLQRRPVIIEPQGEPIPLSHKVVIEQYNIDARGLYSVKAMQDGQEWALDFITKKEYDSLLSIK